MDIVKVINTYIGDKESSLGNAVEDAILDLETLFNLEDEALFSAIQKKQSNPLAFSLGRVSGINGNKLKSNLSAILRDIEDSYQECICKVKATRVGCYLKINVATGYALLSIDADDRRYNTFEITLLVNKEVKAAVVNPYNKNKNRKFEMYVPGRHELSGFAIYDQDAYDYVPIERLYKGCVTPDDFIYRSIVLADQTHGNRPYKGWVIFRKAAESMTLLPNKTTPNLYTYSFKDGFGNLKILQVEFR